MDIVLGVSIAVSLVFSFLFDKRLTKLEDMIIDSDNVKIKKELDSLKEKVERNSEILRKSKP